MKRILTFILGFFSCPLPSEKPGYLAFSSSFIPRYAILCWGCAHVYLQQAGSERYQLWVHGVGVKLSGLVSRRKTLREHGDSRINQCSGNSPRRARIRPASSYVPLHLKRLWPKCISKTKTTTTKKRFFFIGSKKKEQNIYCSSECKDKNKALFSMNYLEKLRSLSSRFS